jgi:hypothetical protein
MAVPNTLLAETRAHTTGMMARDTIGTVTRGLRNGLVI